MESFMEAYISQFNACDLKEERVILGIKHLTGDENGVYFRREKFGVNKN